MNEILKEKIKSLDTKTIKEYLKGNHNINTRARKTTLYNKGEYLQLGNILIKFDIHHNTESLQKDLEYYRSQKDDYSNLIYKLENTLKAYEKYNINNIPILEIYEEKNKPQIDIGGKVQSPCLFNVEFEIYPHLKVYHNVI